MDAWEDWGFQVAKYWNINFSSTGDLYEYDISSQPMWKKHIWIEGSTDDTALMPSMGFSVHGINGAYSISLFLLTKVFFDVITSGGLYINMKTCC